MVLSKTLAVAPSPSVHRPLQRGGNVFAQVRLCPLGRGCAERAAAHQIIVIRTVVLISVADAAGVALIGVIVVYIYWKLCDPRGDDVDDDEDEEGRGLFACPCMRANTCEDSSDGFDTGGGEKKRGNGSGGGGGGEDGELVAIDKGFWMELDELLRSSAYVLGKGGKGIVYKVVVGNGTTPGDKLS
uniref:Uncharacterized protein n=1 Tax=Aegilops tauschii TaxID=37682 RepID=R7W1R2_AEGTA